MVIVDSRPWLVVLVRTAGLRLCVLPLSAAAALGSAGLIMQHAGVATFGLITLVGQLQLALPFADLGMGAAVARAVAQGRMNATVRQTAQTLIRRTALLLCGIGITGAGIAAAIGAAGWWSQWFIVPDSLAQDFDLVMSVVLAMFFLGLPLGLSERILVGEDRADLLVMLGLIPAVCNLGVVAAISVLDLRPMWLALGLPLGTVAFLVVCSHKAHLLQWLKVPSAERQSTSQMVGLVHILAAGLPVVVATAGIVLSEQHGRFVLASVADPRVLSEYALALYLYMPVYSVMYMAANVLWPRFAQGADLRMWRQANLTLIVLGAGAAVGYMLFARPLAGLVSGGQLVPSWPVVICMSAVFVAQSAYLTQANVLTDVAGFLRQAVMAVLLLGSVIFLTIFGVHAGLGAAAPAVSLTVGVVITQVIPGSLMARRMIIRTTSATAPHSRSSTPGSSTSDVPAQPDSLSPIITTTAVTTRGGHHHA